MDLKEKLFFYSITVNFLAMLLTIFLLDVGAVEGNPIMAYFFSFEGVKGILIAVLFSLSVWIIFYLIYFKLINRVFKKEKWLDRASLTGIIVLSILITIDFLNDLCWFVWYLF